MNQLYSPPAYLAEHARARRERLLRMSMHAVVDTGIDLKRRPVEPEPVPEPEPEPEPEPSPVVKLPPPVRPDEIPIFDIKAATVAYLRSVGYNASLIDMRSARRTRHIVYVRQLAMYVCRMLTTASLPQIGRLFGGRDHSTVWYAVNKMHSKRLSIWDDVEGIKAILRERGYNVPHEVDPNQMSLPLGG